MLMMLRCMALNVMPWAADADGAHAHGVQCDAACWWCSRTLLMHWAADADDAHVPCFACNAKALGG